MDHVTIRDIINTNVGGILLHSQYSHYSPRSPQAKDYKIGIPLSTQNEGEKAKTGWLGIRIMCPSGATGLTMDYCFSELELLQSN